MAKFKNDDQQIEAVQKLTRTLAANLDKAEHFGQAQDAVIDFIDKLDTEAFFLGDGDLVDIASRALVRRGKEPEQFLLSMSRVAKEGRKSAKAGK